MKISGEKRLETLGDAFFIVSRRQLTPKDTKKQQKTSKNSKRRQLMKI
jgi:hypothetical protein